MAIKITQPFGFDAQLPNFERDVINSMQYSNNSPLHMTDQEKADAALKYDVGHVVYDEHTRMHYIWLGQTDGWAVPTVQTVRLKFCDVDQSLETLYLDNVERRLATGIGAVTYVPVDSEPADWSDNWKDYYVFDSATGTYTLNQNSAYVGGTTYYTLMFNGL